MRAYVRGHFQTRSKHVLDWDMQLSEVEENGCY